MIPDRALFSTPAKMAEAVIAGKIVTAGSKQLVPLAESHRGLLAALKNIAAQVALHGTMALRPHDLDAAVKVSYFAIDKATGGTTIAEQDANARLMAAGPDLLAALKNLMARELLTIPTPYGHNCEWCGNCCDRAEREAREAIARAEGAQ